MSRPSDESVKAKEPPSVMPQQSLNSNSPEGTGTSDFKLGASRRTTHTRHGNLKQPFAGLVKRRAGVGELSGPSLQILDFLGKQNIL